MIADKIEIRDFAARDKIGRNEVFKVKGILELLRLPIELMGRDITSENLCKNLVNKKIYFIKD